MKKLILSTLIAVGLIASARASSLVTSTGSDGLSYFYDTVGYEFTVGSKNLSVTSLGFYKDPLWTLYSSPTVGIWDIKGNLLASINIPLNSYTDGNYLWGNLSSPVKLNASTSYLIGAFVGNYYGAYMRSGFSIALSSDVSLVGSARNGNAYVFSAPLSTTANSQAIVGPNMQYTALDPIMILGQPADVSLTATNSQKATFSVVATNGVPPYAYQWMKDGVDLTNQTNASLILSNAAANTVGYYSCDVTDQTVTTVTSSNAALNITGVNFNLWQGLVGYYPFSGNFNDQTIYSNNLSNHGTIFTKDLAGVSNNAIYLNGSNYLIGTNVNSIIFDKNTSFAVSCWCYPRDLYEHGYVLCLRSSTGYFYGGPPWYYQLGFFNGNLITETIAGSQNNTALSASLSKQWINVIFILDRNSKMLSTFVNGRLLESSTLDNPEGVLDYANELLIGTEREMVNYFDGSIGKTRIYNRALSSNEVSALFQAEAPVPTNNQTITFPAIPSKAYGTAPFSLTATSSAGTNYSITYSSSDPTVATVSSNKVTITGVGSCLITASQPGDFTYKATNVSRTLTVTQGNQTIPFSAPASRSYTTKTFTLPLNSSAGLPVSYSSSNSSVATISGNVVTITGPGSTVITATQDGNANYKAAPIVNQTLVVSQATQTISFPAIASKAYGAASFSLAAKATSGLPVTYTSSNTNVATVSGNTVTIRGVGSTTITASQAGNANYVAAPSVGQSLTVTKAAQTINFTAPTAQTYGNSSFTLSATSSSGLPVTFTSANTNVATISGNTVTIVGAGSTSITASQPGNANYNAAANVSKTLSVAKATQTVSFSPTTPVTYVKNGTFTLSASSTSGGAITFTSGTPSILSISGKTATMKAKGTVSVTATAAATTNYNAASKTNSITLQ